MFAAAVEKISGSSASAVGRFVGMLPWLALVAYVGFKVWSMLPPEITERF